MTFPRRIQWFLSAVLVWLKNAIIFLRIAPGLTYSAHLFEGLMIAVSCNIPLFVLPARDIIFGLLYSRRTIPPKTPSAIVTQGRSLQVLDETSSLQPSDTNGGTDSQNGTHGAAPRNLTVAMSGNFDLAIERRDSMPADPSDSAPQWLHVSMTLLIVVGSWATAVVCPGVEVIWSFCGSTVSADIERSALARIRP